MCAPASNHNQTLKISSRRWTDGSTGEVSWTHCTDKEPGASKVSHKELKIERSSQSRQPADCNHDVGALWRNFWALQKSIWNRKHFENISAHFGDPVKPESQTQLRRRGQRYSERKSKGQKKETGDTRLLPAEQSQPQSRLASRLQLESECQRHGLVRVLCKMSGRGSLCFPGGHWIVFLWSGAVLWMWTRSSHWYRKAN